MSLEDIIKETINQDGPISISDYMELCLSHPQYGYYIKHNPFGESGDFITAPEISQVFGELLGLWCADVWAQRGGGPAALVELGPGRGTLMSDALRATRMIEDFHEHITVHMVETSPILQSEQFYKLQNEHERIEWHESIEQLPEKPLIIIANEFFDALPIRQHVQEDGQLKERCVGLSEDGKELAFVNQTAGLSLAKGDSEIKDGTVIESCPLAKSMMGRLAEHIHQYGGALIAIDYGYLGDSHQDTLQAVKDHNFHPVLKDPGKVDLTAHVDFASLLDVAADHGLATHGAVEQGKFLVRLGAEVRTERLLQTASQEQGEQLISGVKRLIDPAQMGELFKVIAVLSDHDIVPAGFDHAHFESSHQ
ncbi:MAG: SAM-dependent methyltransferase [Rickettsiales bacterium]|nr:SAM-dependent methyltransferase [Rickettsiales bacterium]